MLDRALVYGLTAASATTMGAAILFAEIPTDQAQSAALFMMLASAAFGGLAVWKWIQMDEDV